MSGVELLGFAASVIQVADTGLKLSIKLYTFTRKVKQANKNIDALAHEIATTGAVLQQLGETLSEKKGARLCKPQAVSTAQQLLGDCQAVFRRLEKIIEDGDVGKRNKISKILPRFTFVFRESEIEELRVNVERLKSSLLVILQVLGLAELLRNGDILPVVKDQRDLLETLIQESAANQKRYEELSKLIKDKEETTTVQLNQSFTVLAAHSIGEVQPKDVKADIIPPKAVEYNTTHETTNQESTRSSHSDLPLGMRHHAGKIVDHGSLVTALLDEVASQRYKIDHAHRMGLHNGILDIHWNTWAGMRKTYGHEVFLKLFPDFTDVSSHWIDQSLLTAREHEAAEMYTPRAPRRTSQSPRQSRVLSSNYHDAFESSSSRRSRSRSRSHRSMTNLDVPLESQRNSGKVRERDMWSKEYNRPMEQESRADLEAGLKARPVPGIIAGLMPLHRSYRTMEDDEDELDPYVERQYEKGYAKSDHERHRPRADADSWASWVEKKEKKRKKRGKAKKSNLKHEEQGSDIPPQVPITESDESLAAYREAPDETYQPLTPIDIHYSQPMFSREYRTTGFARKYGKEEIIIRQQRREEEEANADHKKLKPVDQWVELERALVTSREQADKGSAREEEPSRLPTVIDGYGRKFTYGYCGNAARADEDSKRPETLKADTPYPLNEPSTAQRVHLAATGTSTNPAPRSQDLSPLTGAAPPSAQEETSATRTEERGSLTHEIPEGLHYEMPIYPYAATVAHSGHSTDSETYEDEVPLTSRPMPYQSQGEEANKPNPRERSRSRDQVPFGAVPPSPTHNNYTLTPTTNDQAPGPSELDTTIPPSWLDTVVRTKPPAPEVDWTAPESWAVNDGFINVEHFVNYREDAADGGKDEGEHEDTVDEVEKLLREYSTLSEGEIGGLYRGGCDDEDEDEDEDVEMMRIE